MDWSEFKKFRRDRLQASGQRFWVYHSADGFNCPDHHLALDGIVLPPEHPFWARWFPPHYARCGCHVSAAHLASLVPRLGGDPEKPLPDWWDKVDPAEGSFDP